MTEQANKPVVMPRPTAWNNIDTPSTGPVTARTPLEIDLYTSMRSPYAYLAMDRYVAMTQDYNLKINLRLIYPVAIRDAQFFLKAPNYRYLYDPHDMAREAKFRGIPYRWPVPDPVVMDNKALKVADHADQPHIFRLYRIGALLQLEHEDKAVAWIHRMFCLIWDGSTDNWQDLISGALDQVGLDGAAIEARAAADEGKYLNVIEENQIIARATGHAGVPNAVFRGEPFWGQDRIETLLWRLKLNGLTKRPGPLAAPLG